MNTALLVPAAKVGMVGAARAARVHGHEQDVRGVRRRRWRAEGLEDTRALPLRQVAVEPV